MYLTEHSRGITVAPSRKRTGSPEIASPSCEVEVTTAMIEAGEVALDACAEVASQQETVRAIYIAMEKLRAS